MSLRVFEVVLQPDPTLRILVLRSGVVLLLTGIVLISFFPVSPLWRFVFSAIWLADCLREIHRLRRGSARIRSIVLDSQGVVATIDDHGIRHASTLLTGSMVLPGLAWIRVNDCNGRRHSDLFTRRRTGPGTWHRLQLLWHQAREAFCHPPGP